MNLRRRLEERITKKIKEIQELEGTIKEAKAYVQGVQDTLKMLPRDSRVADAARAMRAGSQVAKAMQLLKDFGTPMHILDILKGLDKEITKGNRASLVGSLGAYVRRGETFTRPKPATFGLVEWAEEEPRVDEPTEDVPDDFGVIDTGEEEDY